MKNFFQFPEEFIGVDLSQNFVYLHFNTNSFGVLQIHSQTF